MLRKAENTGTDGPIEKSLASNERSWNWKPNNCRRNDAEMTETRCQARTSGFSCVGLLVESSVVSSRLPLLQPIPVQPAVFLRVLEPTCWFFPPARKNSWRNVYQRVILTYINSIHSAGSTFFHCKKLTAIIFTPYPRQTELSIVWNGYVFCTGVCMVIKETSWGMSW